MCFISEIAKSSSANDSIWVRRVPLTSFVIPVESGNLSTKWNGKERQIARGGGMFDKNVFC